MLKLCWQDNRCDVLDCVCYYCVSGIGVGLSFLPAMAAPMKVFKGKYAATITGSITTAENVGPLVFTAIYNVFFLRDGTYDQQDLRGFMLFVAFLSAIVNLMGTWFFGWSESLTDPDINDEATYLVTSERSGKEPYLEDKPSSNLESCAAQENANTSSNCDREPRIEITPLRMVCNVKFQAMLWSGITLNSLKYYCIYNVNVILVSLHQEQYELIVPYIPHATSVVFKTLMGFLIDNCLQSVPLVYYLIFSGVADVLFFVLAAFWIDNIHLLMVAILFWTIAGDLGIIVEPLMNIEQFGLSMVAINWGFFLAVWTTMVFSIQLIFAKTYNHHADPNSGLCFGGSCFWEQLFVNSSLAAFALILAVFYNFKTRCHGNEMHTQPTNSG